MSAATLAALAGETVTESAPDLERDAGAGYIVRAYFAPDLAHAGAPDAEAFVIVSRGAVAIDVARVPARDGLAAWRHAATYCTRYAGELTAREVSA